MDCHLLGIMPAVNRLVSPLIATIEHVATKLILENLDMVRIQRAALTVAIALLLTWVTAVSALTAGNRRQASAVGSSHCAGGRSARRNQPSCRGCTKAKNHVRQR